jgi:hypothetical protein
MELEKEPNNEKKKHAPPPNPRHTQNLSLFLSLSSFVAEAFAPFGTGTDRVVAP